MQPDIICTQNCGSRIDNRKSVYFISELRKTGRGYQVCIAKEGELGFYLTDWYWNCSRADAEILCEEKNKALGINKKEAMKIILMSMRKKVPTKEKLL